MGKCMFVISKSRDFSISVNICMWQLILNIDSMGFQTLWRVTDVFAKLNISPEREICYFLICQLD